MVLALYLIEFESYSSLEAIKKVREMRFVKENNFSKLFLWVYNKWVYKSFSHSSSSEQNINRLQEFQIQTFKK